MFVSVTSRAVARPRKVVPAVVALFGLALMVGGARPAAAIDVTAAGPFNLNQAGQSYNLTANINRAGTAFTISASNITFNLKGFDITGNHTGVGILVFNGAQRLTGIRVNGFNPSNAVDRSIVQGFSDGMLVNNNGGFNLGSTIVRNNTANGVELVAGTSDSTLLLNEIHSNTLDGVIADGGGRNTYLANWLHHNGDAGLELRDDDNTIGGNLSTRNTGHGFAIFAVSLRNQWLSNAAEQNGGSGFSIIQASSNNTLRFNRAVGNKLHGIELRNTVNGLVELNLIVGNGLSGLQMSLLESCVIRSNTITGNGTVAGNGITVDIGSSETLFERNTVSGNLNGDGIHSTTNADRNRFLNNTVNNNGDDGIEIVAGSVGNTISGNTARNNGDIDVIDNNSAPSCVNTWSNNRYGDKGGAHAATCIPASV